MIALTTKEERNARKRELSAIRREKFALADVERLPTSVIIWRGPSLIDGTEIVVVVTNLAIPSENRKTGDMAQVYIFPVNTRPVEAIATGADVSVCGDCPLKPSVAKARRAAGELDVEECYVNKGWMDRTWFSIPKLPYVEPEIVSRFMAAIGLGCRDGTWGDPGGVPISVWQALHKFGGKGTSYTHQWHKASPALAQFAMASVQTVQEKNAANAIGYRTYRVTTGPLESDEIICPESTVGISCADCGLCAGNRVDAKNIVIRPI